MRAFCGCHSLENITLPDCVEEIGAAAFRTTGIESFIAPKSLRIIRQGAFERCKHLKRVELNDGLAVLGSDEHQAGNNSSGVFRYSALENVVLPQTLKRIGSCAFACCNRLRRIAFPGGLEHIGEYCFYRSCLKSVRLPSALKAIKEGVFSHCQNLRSVELPERLETIGTDAFQITCLERIAFHASLRTIAQGAFARCGSLRSVQFREGLEWLGTDER